MGKSKFNIRAGKMDDMGAIMAIYEMARKFMRETGNSDQWNDGYPSEKDVTKDMENGNCYVGENEEGDVVMVFAFIVGEDPTYKIIEDGEWLNDEPYGTIHRLGSDGRRGGVLASCVNYCLSRIANVRVDTHRDNHPMLSGLSKLGFKKCGKIYCRDGSERIAFQKTREERE